MNCSHALALSGAALLLALSTPSYAQVVRPGQQCIPAVADPSLYRNCRLHMVRGQEAGRGAAALQLAPPMVRGQEVCRCAVAPQALRKMNPNVTATGSLQIGIPGTDPTVDAGQIGGNDGPRGGNAANNSGPQAGGGSSSGGKGGGT